VASERLTECVCCPPPTHPTPGTLFYSRSSVITPVSSVCSLPYRSHPVKQTAATGLIKWHSRAPRPVHHHHVLWPSPCGSWAGGWAAFSCQLFVDISWIVTVCKKSHRASVSVFAFQNANRNKMPREQLLNTPYMGQRKLTLFSGRIEWLKLRECKT